MGALRLSVGIAVLGFVAIVPARPTQAAPHSDEFLGVACASVTSCVAVGLRGNVQATLAEHWNGGTWQAQATKNPGSTLNRLDSVACPSTSLCIAVGTFASGGSDTALVEALHGSTWSVLPTPTVTGATETVFKGVSCSSSTNCVAVGFAEVSNVRTVLVEQWNGSTWKVEPAPSPDSNGSLLRAVACPTSAACTAVGFGDTGAAVAEHWNGSTWATQVVPTPSGASSATLDGVACTAATNCVAVGATDSTTLIESLTGSTWSVQSSPSVGSPSDEPVLDGVRCRGASNCVAVGGFNISVPQPIAEHWNGSAWALQPPPNNLAGGSVLLGVACPASTTCFGAGYADNNISKTVVERWNGTKWTRLTTPNP
jgi:hypothetical protein